MALPVHTALCFPPTPIPLQTSFLAQAPPSPRAYTMCVVPQAPTPHAQPQKPPQRFTQPHHAAQEEGGRGGGRPGLPPPLLPLGRYLHKAAGEMAGSGWRRALPELGRMRVQARGDGGRQQGRTGAGGGPASATPTEGLSK